MHKTKAIVHRDKNGTIVGALPTGYSCDKNEIFEDWQTEENGYILTSLKKATSRNKGNSLERDVAKAFSMWLYGRNDILARTPLSGGWEGSKLGDVCANPAKLMELKLSMPKLYVECKNREGLLSESFFNWLAWGKPEYMTDLIEDTKKKAGGNLWFIVLKGNGVSPWVLTDRKPDVSSLHATLRMEGNIEYYLFSMNQLENVYMYRDMKQLILS